MWEAHTRSRSDGEGDPPLHWSQDGEVLPLPGGLQLFGDGALDASARGETLIRIS